MPGPLADKIISEVVNSSDFQRMASKMLPIFGKITDYNENERRVDLEFVDPISSLIVTKIGVPIGIMGGIHSTIERDDVAVLIFPNGNFEMPVITNVIPSAEYKVYIVGSLTTKTSGGI